MNKKIAFLILLGSSISFVLGPIFGLFATLIIIGVNVLIYAIKSSENSS